MANRQPNAMASSASSVQRGSFNRPSVPQQTNQMPGYGHTTNVDSMRAMNSNGADVQPMGNTNRNNIAYNNRNLSARYNGRSRSPSEGTNPEDEKGKLHTRKYRLLNYCYSKHIHHNISCTLTQKQNF
jgi:hypothetical protein